MNFAPTAPPTKRERTHAANLRKQATSSNDPTKSGVMPAGRYSIPSLTKMLEKVKERVLHRNPQGMGQVTADWADAAITAIHSDDWMKEKAQITYGAAHKDPECVAMHAAAVEITTENIVRANSNWLPFFESRSLADNEQPVILPDRYGMMITVDTIGLDGGNRTISAQRSDLAPLWVPLHMRASNWIEYPLSDVYAGSVVKELSLSQFDVARDRAWRTDALLAGYVLYGGANTRLVSTFVTTGDVSVRDYQAHPRVNVANLPTGNVVTLGGNSTTSKFRKEVFDAIIQYCRSWGDDVMEGGTPTPVEISVASSQVTDFLSQVTMTSYQNFAVQQIFEGGMLLTYGGYNWIITGNNTIDPNQGMAYVRMDQPIGVVFDKPSLAKAIVDETPALLVQNKGRTCEVWCEGFGMPIHWRKRMFGVCFKTAV